MLEQYHLYKLWIQYNSFIYSSDSLDFINYVENGVYYKLKILVMTLNIKIIYNDIT